MGRFIDLTGKRFGKLTVVSRAENAIEPNGKPRVMWNCHCDCGNDTVVAGSHLRNKHTTSCGCYGREARIKSNTTHGKSNTPIYRTWRHMIERCYNKNNKRYNSYGGRGIKVYDKWINDFQSFYEYVSSLPHYGENGYSLDRIDNDGNYEPNNIRWADDYIQNNNQRTSHFITFDGKTQTISQWSRELDIPYDTLYSRISRGWSIDRALTTK